MREHLAAAWKARGVRPEALDTPEAPAFLRYLLEWFAELSARRVPGMASVSPVTWPEMQAWASMTDTRVAGWEARALAHLDNLWRAAWHAGRPKQRTPGDGSPAPRRRVGGSRNR